MRWFHYRVPDVLWSHCPQHCVSYLYNPPVTDSVPLLSVLYLYTEVKDDYQIYHPNPCDMTDIHRLHYQGRQLLLKLVYSYTPVCKINICNKLLLYLQGLTLVELTTHLKRKCITNTKLQNTTSHLSIVPQM